MKLPKFHACPLDRQCREVGAPWRLQVETRRAFHTLALTPGARMAANLYAADRRPLWYERSIKLQDDVRTVRFRKPKGQPTIDYEYRVLHRYLDALQAHWIHHEGFDSKGAARRFIEDAPNWLIASPNAEFRVERRQKAGEWEPVPERRVIRLPPHARPRA